MSFAGPSGLYLDAAKGGPLLTAPEQGTIHLVIGGPIERAQIAALCETVRLVLAGGDADRVNCDVGAITDPDLGTIDALARLQLTAQRLGCQVRLRDASVELEELLSLVGLGDVVPCAPGSRLQAGRQAEGREEPRGIEEEADPPDPTG